MMLANDPWLSFESRADSIIAQGIQADRASLALRLQMLGEFRFAGYAAFFRDDSGGYRSGTTLEAVWRLYEFDSHLSLLCFEAVRTIEVQVRSQLAYHFVRKHGNDAYLDKANFPNFASNLPEFSWWEGSINDAINKELREPSSYTTTISQALPIGMIVERFDFGTTLSFFKGVNSGIQKDVAATAGLPDVIASSWLLSLRDLRNRCAHHHRIWNWRFRNSTKIPRGRKFPEWHSPAFPSNRRMGILLTICRYWLNRIDPGNGWTERVFGLFDAYPELPAGAMGLPECWRQHPLWVG